MLSQTQVESLAKEDELILLCGHYEGIDERVLEEVVTDYVSIGDYVLTGGELAAAVLIDAVSRFVPGVLHNEESSQFESLQDSLLEYPQYTRPEVWHGRAVPEVLLSGDHGKIEAWRHAESVKRTAQRRPDLLEKNYRVQCVWYGEPGYGELAERVARSLSRYGDVLDYNRRKLQKQTRSMDGKDLLVCVIPSEEGEPAVRERFRNLRGDGTPAVLVVSSDCGGQTDEILPFLKERQFRVLHTIGLADASEEAISGAALRVREMLL